MTNHPNHTTHARAQVLIVGDLNIAAAPCDAHQALSWERLYCPEELAALRSLFSRVDDAWRGLHPHENGVFSVWNERTSARSFNVVRACLLMRVGML